MDVRKQLEHVALYDRKRLVNYIRRKTGCEAEAEEIVQEAFLAAFKNLKRFKGTSAMRTWVTRIAINCFLMRYRKNFRHQRISDAFAEQMIVNTQLDPHDLEVETAVKLDYARVTHILGKMPKCYRIPITMRGQGLMYKEIAELMGVSPGTVKSHVARGIKKLQERL